MIPSGMERDSGHRIVEAVDSTRILVVDDDPIIQKALRRLFESEGYIVDIQRDGKAALDAFHSTAPAAVILDLRLPVMSGEEVCREIRRKSHTVPIIVLSAATDLVEKIRLLELGANDYVTKPFSPRELLARLRAVIRYTNKYDAPNAACFDGVSVDFVTMNATLDGRPVALTVQEFKLLKYFLQRAEHVLSREEILREVLDYRTSSYSRTVDMYILRLRQKLERDPGHPIHFCTVHRVGYRFVP